MYNLKDYTSLIDRGFVKRKDYTNGRYGGLSIIKYSRKVMYTHSWDISPLLLEARGHIFDTSSGEIVSLPLPKLFDDIDRTYVNKIGSDQKLVAVEKINGYMCAVTYDSKYGMIVSTTGTLDSDYAEKAREEISKCTDWEMFKILNEYTFIFEIVREDDPHIVKEQCGAYLLCFRDKTVGRVTHGPDMRHINNLFGTSFKSPSLKFTTYGEIEKRKGEEEGEGWILYSGDEALCKVKTDYYKQKKLLMRMNKSRVENLFKNKDLSLYPKFTSQMQWVFNNVDMEEWVGYTDQQRRTILEEKHE